VSRLPEGRNPWERAARADKAVRLALILSEAGLRRAGEVALMTGEQRALTLAVLGAGLGRPASASDATWRAVASVVGFLGGGSGGRRRTDTVPSRVETVERADQRAFSGESGNLDPVRPVTMSLYTPGIQGLSTGCPQSSTDARKGGHSAR
jgi:hypothetical protein